MTGRRGPTLRAQLLGQRLRELREDAGLTLKDVAEYIQRDPSTVSRFESGFLPARVPEVLAYLDLCGIDDLPRRDGLKRLSQDVFQKGWWDGFADDIPGLLVDRTWLESRALEVRLFQVAVLPGFMQTREYAETVMRAASPQARPEQIDRWVEFRMTRQQLLTKAEPLRLVAILDEAVLRRAVGGGRIMRAQLEHLIGMAAQPHVEILVLPSAAGAHASPDGSFEIFKMPEPYNDVGFVETPAGVICIEADRVERLAEAYDRIRDVALPQPETVAFISDIAKERID